MHGTASRRSRRSLLTKVVAVVVVAAAGWVSLAPMAASQVSSDEGGADVARPGTWRGTGGALGVRAYFNMEPRPLPVDDLLTVHIPDVTTSWSSTGDTQAKASSIFPGQTVVGLPDLLATFGVPGIDQILPPYPATAFAGPTDPDVTSADGTSRARIGEGLEFIEAVGRAAVPGVTDALAPFVDVEGAVARSRQEFQDGLLVSRSESDVGAVSILGGVVTFDGVRAVAESRVGETGEPEVAAETHVGNVSIAGTQVRIGDQGIEVGGTVIPPGGLPDTLRPSGIVGRVNDVVKAFGLSIRLLGSETDTEGRAARARAGGLIVEAAFPVEGPALPALALDQLPVNPNDLLGDLLPLPLPDLDPNIIYRTYLLSVVLGEANTDVFADAGGGGLLDGELGGLGDAGLGDGGGLTDAGSFGDAGGDFALSTGGSGTGTTGSAAGSGGGSESVTIGSTDDPGGLLLLGANAADRVGVLFGFFVLLAVVTLAAMRLITLPAREGT